MKELLDSQYLCEVHKFSKFIHGFAALSPTIVQEAPYWIDDQSIAESLVATAVGPDGAVKTLDVTSFFANSAVPRDTSEVVSG